MQRFNLSSSALPILAVIAASATLSLGACRSELATVCTAHEQCGECELCVNGSCALDLDRPECGPQPGCGDGTLEPLEKCDTKIAAGQPGACPQSCDDKIACTKDSLLNAGGCDATCSNQPITQCASGDGCCPSGCDALSDSDCSPSCGNGTLEPPEKCDTQIAAGKPGACPTGCDDKIACTKDSLLNAGGCDAVCSNPPITQCDSGDGCCPTGCDALSDSDCSPSCGNGTLEPPEKCDTKIAAGQPGACPQSCDDKVACTDDNLLNSGSCDATCSNTPITQCANGDGCCPSGCSHLDDDDCPPPLGWAVSGGGSGYDEVDAVAVDASGNVYVTGYYENGAAFGTATLPSQTGMSGYLAKLSPSGQFLWAIPAPAHKVAVDSKGDVYIAGDFWGQVTLGSTTLTGQAGQRDIAVAKLSPSGQYLWAVSAGGPDFDGATGVAVDAAGNVFVSGIFKGQASFGTKTITSQGGQDGFLAKLSPDHEFQWAVSQGGASNDSVYGLGVDGAGRPTITGAVFGPVTIGTASFAGVGAAFVAKYDGGGLFQWAAFGDCESGAAGVAVATDSGGSTYVTGTFVYQIRFGGYSGPFLFVTYASESALFLTKLDPTGSFEWADKIDASGSGGTAGNGLALDAQGQIFVSGTFWGDLWQLGKSYVHQGGGDAMLLRYSATGSLDKLVTAGGTGAEYGSALALDPNGVPHVGGSFAGSTYFGSQQLSSKGNLDAYLWKVPGL